MNTTTPVSDIGTVCRKRYAEIIQMLHARLCLTLEPDANFQFTQPIGFHESTLSNEQEAWALATIRFGRRDIPIDVANNVAADQLAHAAQFEDGQIKVRLSIPEGLFELRIIPT